MLALKQREKIIGILAVLVLVGIGAYLYVIDPYLQNYDKLSTDLKAAQTKDKDAIKLLNNRSTVDRNWKKLLETGVKSDPAEAENQALHAVRNIAESTRIDLQSLKPERSGRAGDFALIRVQATGLGTTATISDLLYQIETAKVPLKVGDLRMTSRKEGSDDLSFALSVSTIVYAPLPEKITPARSNAKKEAP